VKTVRKILSTLIALVAFSTTAEAVEFHFDGYVDFRAVIPGDQVSWMDGELGKLRYGTGDNNFQFAELVGQGVVQITPALMLLGVARIEPNQRTFLDVLETYARYRPVSTSAFRWSVKAGAFFPPISLENTEIGWTSPWTLTPSAINAWVGEELRTIGLEGTVEWRSDARTISAYASIYGWNDPTGILLADRGWALHDRPTGLNDRPMLPDVLAYQLNQPLPYRTWEFLEIDDRPGWYAGAAWDETGIGHADIMYYNNEADPKAIRRQVAWRTDFWNLGLKTQIGDLTLLAQGMRGETFIYPSPYFWSDTYFESAYLLAGYNISQDWRIAGRVEIFSTNETNTYGSSRSEHGNAQTLAVNYLPYDWLRVTGEVIRVESTRNQRLLDGGPAHAVENQFQLSVRFYLP
jgi:hypothetical protein